ncbi:hypothetical protein B0T18DRAFT_432655 [Schizothecium vesticola]|uniref:Uncharacterized protein n=1 Tax=Schizothecium vesticola TaxID=314040 RepID=A0AA40ELJ5_9PEZI|nr:hypothetical protein B0T18DRAFT_432655 [Schizothecium vesticola]
MSGPNIFLSNGTCYTGPGQKLHESFIPCGNAAFGHITCCGAGDNCLANDACWGIHGTGYGSSLTYMAGCTDPEYKDPSCPKKIIAQPWVALTHCESSPGVWAVCSQINNPTTLQPGASCSCTNTASATIAFSDAAVLSSSASLPRATGESIQYFPGYYPTSPPGSDPTSGVGGDNTGGGSSVGGGDNPSPTGPGGSPNETGGSSPSGGNGAGNVNNPPQSASGMSSRTKTVIGVGVGVGVAFLLALLAVCLYRRRRRRVPRSDEGIAKTSNPRMSAASTTPTMSEADGRPISEADGKAARPWSMRSELEGSSVPAAGQPHHAGASKADANDAEGGLSPVAELPGSEGWQR